MTTGDLAGIVARARDVLRGWDGKSSGHEMAMRIHDALRPLVAEAEQLTDDARLKLQQIEQYLERLAECGIAGQDRESLDMLMLGLWIRVDNSFAPLNER